MNGALSKEIENGSKMRKNSGLSWLVIFWEEEGVCGCSNKWRGATMDPRGRGHAQGGGRALDPRGQVLAPPAVFSVLDILKCSRKNHI